MVEQHQEQIDEIEEPQSPGQVETPKIVVSKEDFRKAEADKTGEPAESKPQKAPESESEDGDEPEPENNGGSGDSGQGQPPKKGKKGRPRRKLPPMKLKMPELEKEEGVESYKELMITELKFRGIFDSVSNTDDRVMAKVFRLSQQQRNELQSIRKELYTAFRKLKSFKIEKKYVIPKHRLPELEQVFQDQKKEFEALRIVIFKTLRQDWKQICKDIQQKYPDLPIDFNDVQGMTPEDTDFLSMDYTIRSLDNWFSEMDGLKKSFAKGNVTEEEIARRIDRQKDRIVDSVRAQYEGELVKLNDTVRTLQKAVRKSAKLERIEKLKTKADKAVDDIAGMAKLLGEEDAFKVNLDALQEMLTEDLLGEN